MGAQGWLLDQLSVTYGAVFFPSMASQGFDVSSAILAFLADKTHTSLELPHMTTGQRKQTKKLVEQHPELTCESYGFGHERQLHLFKRRQETETVPAVASNEIIISELSCKIAPDSAAGYPYESAALGGGAVSVKNTFIDDFIENNSDALAQESRVVTTMPPALSRILLNIASSADGKREVEVSSASTSSGQSATDSTSSSPRPEREQPSPIKVPLGAPTPSCFEVRNTFIHYTQPADRRIVQSMPHGMFGQCLIADLLGDAAFKAQEATATAARQTVEQRPAVTPLTSVPDIAAEEGTLAPGTEVVITGLAKLPTFNGLKGTIQSFDEEAARFSVLLIEPAGGHKWVKVKRENLNIVTSLPPPRSPSSCFPEVQATPTWEERPIAHPLGLTALV